MTASVFSALTEEQIRSTVEIPAREARYAPWPQVITPEVRAGYPDRLWAHQAEAIEAIARGEHTVIATGTGSGKSLAAWAPILSDLYLHRSRTLRRRRHAALYLSPTKALAHDQLVSLTAVMDRISAAAIENAGGELEPEKPGDPAYHRPLAAIAVDGDTPADVRAWARSSAAIVATNPDWIHHALLPHHRTWKHLLASLKFIVIDEFHAYRGMFGAHVALVLRRLLRAARRYGSEPRVIFLSATAGRPAETAWRFLGAHEPPVTAITDDASPHAPTNIALIEPTIQGSGVWIGDPDTHLSTELEAVVPRIAATSEAARLTATAVAEGSKALCFVRSRAATESVAGRANQILATSAPHLAGLISAYRGGYLPEERRDLESAFRSGDIRALVSTSALEVGIDIAELDAVILTGWPGTMASFFQQVGRAGRAGRPGQAVFIAREDPLDQFYARSPELIAHHRPEAVVVDPSNPHVLTAHLASAASEFPLTPDDLEHLDPAASEIAWLLVESGLLVERPAGLTWNIQLGSAHAHVDLRGSEFTLSIVDVTHGEVVGTVDRSRADRTVFPGAIYLHQDRHYDVLTLTDDTAEVTPRLSDDLRTYATADSTVTITRERERTRCGLITASFGDVEVVSQVTGYEIRDIRAHRSLGNRPLDLPPRSLHTSATWYCLPESFFEEAGIAPEDIPGALHGAEHAAIAILPAIATCDRWDIGGLSTAYHPDTNAATVIVHDALPGGSGCARAGFDDFLGWLELTLAAIDRCPCTSGCPRCIQSPKCGNGNSPLSKDGARELLQLIIQES